MKIEIIKDHDSGLKKGQVKEVSTGIGNSLITEGLAKEVKSDKAPKKDKAKKVELKNKAK